MIKKVVEQYECDKCGRDAARYSIVFSDSTLLMDRCELHAKKIEAFRNEQGEWVSNTPTGKAVFKKSSLAELRLAQDAHKRGDKK